MTTSALPQARGLLASNSILEIYHDGSQLRKLFKFTFSCPCCHLTSASGLHQFRDHPSSQGPFKRNFEFIPSMYLTTDYLWALTSSLTRGSRISRSRRRRMGTTASFSYMTLIRYVSTSCIIRLRWGAPSWISFMERKCKRNGWRPSKRKSTSQPPLEWMTHLRKLDEIGEYRKEGDVEAPVWEYDKGPDVQKENLRIVLALDVDIVHLPPGKVSVLLIRRNFVSLSHFRHVQYFYSFLKVDFCPHS